MKYITALIALLAPAAMSGAQVVFTTDFNNETPGLNAVPTGFDLLDGTVDILGTGPNGTSNDIEPGNGYYLDLDGSSGNAGRLATEQVFAPGSYTLTFELAGNQRSGTADTVVIEFGDFTDTITFDGTQANQPFTLFSYSFTTTVSGPLVFDHAGGDNVGLLLDDVTVSIPEPSAAALAAGALLLMLHRQRR